MSIHGGRGNVGGLENKVRRNVELGQLRHGRATPFITMEPSRLSTGEVTLESALANSAS